MVDWLPHDLLLKLDRCLMAHAVEGAHAVPRPWCRRRGIPPAGLDETARRHRQMDPAQMAGKALADGTAVRAEAGFTVPVGAWIKGQGARLGPLVAAQPGVAEIAHPDG